MTSNEAGLQAAGTAHKLIRTHSHWHSINLPNSEAHPSAPVHHITYAYRVTYADHTWKASWSAFMTARTTSLLRARMCSPALSSGQATSWSPRRYIAAVRPAARKGKAWSNTP